MSNSHAMPQKRLDRTETANPHTEAANRRKTSRVVASYGVFQSKVVSKYPRNSAPTNQGIHQ